MGVIMLPLVVPSIILAVALLIVLRKVFDIPLTLWTVGAGHILLCVPFSMLVLMSRLEGSTNRWRRRPTIWARTAG
jgi:ABC-type spermidine/putrescine transport system, permease component II